MATDNRAIHALAERKLALLREFLQVTQQELLLVDLDGLSPLLERKDALIGEIRSLDRELARRSMGEALPQDVQAELADVVGAVLENERTLEARIDEEQSRLRQELREFDQETRLRRYLERSGRKGATVDLKK